MSIGFEVILTHVWFSDFEMELYHKVNNVCFTNLVIYPDCSVKQVCFNPRMKEVKIYRAAPDVEDGYCYLILQILEQVIMKMGTLFDYETMVIPVTVKPSKQLVYLYNEEFGNWELGFQKKAVSQKRKAIVVGECSNVQEN